MRCGRCSAPVASTVKGAVLCPACLLADVRIGRPDAAWMRARFPHLEGMEVFGEEDEKAGSPAIRFHAREFGSQTPVVLYLVTAREVARLLAEIEKRAHLDHPGIAPVMDYGEIEGFIYAIEVRPPGELLSRSIQNAEVSRTDMLAMLPQIAEATGFAAERGVVLPNQPETVYVAEGGQVTMTGLPVEDPDNGTTRWFEEHPSVGTRIGRYELRELIGEGGFAEVYRARQERPVRREVALKILKLGMDTRQVLARFAVERQALAQMTHSGIARIYDAGATGSGRPYIAMELVEGGPVTDYCDERGLSLDGRARLMSLVCRAVHHGHTKGVVHRDLKPSNVLVSEEDGSPVPKVIDFGIARAAEEPLTSNTFFTRAQQLLGSPSYMSPEQVEGSEGVDGRSDVYSLGCLLYSLLTSEPPLPESSLEDCSMKEIIEQVQRGRVQHPADRVAGLARARREEVAASRSSKSGQLVGALSARGLSDIALKALSPKPADRYGSAGAMADDLESWVEEGTEQAPHFHRRAVHRVKKAAVILAVLFVLLAVVWYHSPLGRRMATSRGADGTLRPVALFQFGGNLQSAISGGPEMEAIGDPDLSYESVQIDGEEAEVLHFPRFEPSQWLKVKNVIGVNGPWYATETNRWTLVFDVMFPEISGPIALFQCHSENAGDAEVHVGPRGFGSRYGLSYGFVREGEWNRIVVTSSDNGRAQYYTVYLNGTRMGIPLVKGLHSASFAFDDEILILCEGDNRTGEGYLNSFAVYDLALTDAEVRALGPPVAAGIPAEFTPGPPGVHPRELIAGERVALVAGHVGSEFGGALAMGGDEVWIASPRADLVARNAGEVRIYRTDDGVAWVEAGRVEHPDNLNPQAGFGSSLAMGEHLAAVGAPGVFGGGAVYCYEREQGGWSAPRTLVPDLAGEVEGFGMTTEVVGSSVAVGAGRASGGGVVCFFDGTSGTQSQVLDLGAATVGGTDEIHLAGGERHLAIGGPGGEVGVFLRDEAGLWREESRVRRADGSGAGQALVQALAMTRDGSRLAVADDGGEVSLYHRRSGREWVHHATLTEPNSTEGSGYGERLEFASSLRLLVGAPEGLHRGGRTGTVFLYENRDGNWTLQRVIAPAEGSVEGRFGGSMAVAGGRLWIGSAEDHTDRLGGGAAYPLVLPRFEHQRFATLSPNLVLGSGVGIVGDLAAVGVPGIDHRAYGGEVQVFRRQGDDRWTREYRTPEDQQREFANSSFAKVAVGEGRVWTNSGGEVLEFQEREGAWGIAERAGAEPTTTFASGRSDLLVSSNDTLQWSAAGLARLEVMAGTGRRESAGWTEVSLHGKTAAAVKPGGGGVQLWHRGTAGWTEGETLPAPLGLSPGVGFGSALDHGQRWLAVGAPSNDWRGNGVGSGAAVVYDLQDPGRPPVLLPCPEAGEMPAYGWAVAVAGDVVLVGNPSVRGARAPGRVYVYRHEESSGGWRFAETLQASNAEPGDEFGVHLAADEGWAVIGAKSSWVYFFRLQRAGAGAEESGGRSAGADGEDRH